MMKKRLYQSMLEFISHKAKVILSFSLFFFVFFYQSVCYSADKSIIAIPSIVQIKKNSNNIESNTMVIDIGYGMVVGNSQKVDNKYKNFDINDYEKTELENTGNSNNDIKDENEDFSEELTINPIGDENSGKEIDKGDDNIIDELTIDPTNDSNNENISKDKRGKNITNSSSSSLNQNSQDNSINQDSSVRDPYEKTNRKIYNWNKKFNNVVMKPEVEGFHAITRNQKTRKRVHNFFYNLKEPVYLINGALQGSFRKTVYSAGRFIINSTIGIGGIFDPASKLGLPREKRDYISTLSKWKLPSGNYYITPVMGPTTSRNTFGSILNFTATPMFTLCSTGVYILWIICDTVMVADESFPILDDLEAVSLDDYVALRSAYISKYGK